MNCYLIDDEPHAIGLLTEYISRLKNSKVVGTNISAKKALLEIRELKNVELVFTDIYMPELSGFDAIRQLPPNIKTVVTTVNSHYREPAYELKVSWFLLKPFSYESFQEIILFLAS